MKLSLSLLALLSCLPLFHNARAEVTVTLDEKLYAVRSGTLGTCTVTEGTTYIEYDKITGSGDFVLSSDYTSEGEALDLSSTNVWLESDENGVLKLTGVNSANTATTTSGRTATAYALLVAGGTVEISDGIETGDLKSNLSVGTVYGQDATLTISDGAKVTTTAYYNTVGSYGSTGTINVTGAGTVLSTQQITLGSNQALAARSDASLGTDEMNYVGLKMTVSEEDYNALVAKNGAAYGTGIINVKEGATLNIGDGNTNTSTNKLQIFNGELNVDGTGSQVLLNEDVYFTMDTNYGTSASFTGAKAVLNITNGGVVKNADGETMDAFTMGQVFGSTSSPTETVSIITVDGDGSALDMSTKDMTIIGWGSGTIGGTETSSIVVSNNASAKISTASWGIIAYTGGSEGADLITHDIDIRAESGGEFFLSSASYFLVGGGSAVSATKGTVDFSAAGENSSLTLATDVAMVLNNSSSSDLKVSVRAEDQATTTLNTGTFLNLGTGTTVSVESGATVNLNAGTNINLRPGSAVVVEGENSTLNTSNASGAVNLNSGSSVTVGTGATWKSVGGDVYVEGAEISNSGTVDISGALTLAGTAKLVNAGVLNVGSDVSIGEATTTVFNVSLTDANTLTSTEITMDGGAFTLSDGASFELVFGAEITLAQLQALKAADEEFSLTLVSGMSDDSAAAITTSSLSTLLGNTTFTFTNAEDYSVVGASYAVEGNNLVLKGKVIPEPATGTLSVLALAALAFRRRRR